MNIITAREAFDLGLKRYFTGKKCIHGHTCERMVSNGCCVECLHSRRSYQRTKEWRKKNPGCRTEEARKYRTKYPEKVRKTALDYRKRNIDKVRENNKLLKRRMRLINPEKEKERLNRFYEKKRKERVEIAGREKPELCEICSTNEFQIVFDHCHVNGNFRGWICDRCNRVLGIVKDSVELLCKLSNYLEVNYDKINCQEKE